MPVEFQYKEASIISKPRSVREAHTKLQAFYLDPISDIAAALGVQLNNAKAWKPTSANRYTRKGERDAIIFPEVFEMLSSRRQMGDPIITNRESEWSLVQPVINDTPEPVEEMVRYSTRKTENFLESESSTQGWHFESTTVTEAKAGGSFMGISADASVSNTTTVGASGQYDSASEKGQETSSAVDKTTKVTVPPHSTRIVEQYEESAKIKVPITELNVLLTLPSLTVLTLNDAGITDATRIGQLTDLEKLDLAFNRLKDLTVLASLENLTHLHLDANTADINDRTASNSLSDISPLANLENLEVLNLTWNAITDISPLVGMTSLTQLRLTHNAITNLYLLYPLTQQNPPVDVDITVLNGPAVEVPDENLAAALRSEIGLTVGADITEVDMRAVTSLIVKDRSITDLTGLEYTTNLTTLNLDNNNISDLSPLSAYSRTCNC